MMQERGNNAWVRSGERVNPRERITLPDDRKGIRAAVRKKGETLRVLGGGRVDPLRVVPPSKCKQVPDLAAQRRVVK
jgi:hypothetical protein